MGPEGHLSALSHPFLCHGGGVRRMDRCLCVRRKDAEMEITINGNVTINNQAQSAQEEKKEERQPIDRTNEVLIDNSTSFNNLIRILQGNPEAVEAAAAETEEKEREARYEQMKKAYMEDADAFPGTDDSDADSLVKAKRRPGATFLRNYEPRIAMREIGEDGLCEVFANGYAVYDNGNRKTVVWVPDCGSTTYYFGPLKDKEKEYLKQKEEVGEDVMGELPWYTPVLIAGEDSIERNLIHPKTASNSNDKSWEEEADIKAAKKWAGGYHFDNPEDILIQKEERLEALRVLNDKQRKVFDRYCFDGIKQSEIAEEMGVTRQSVNETIQWAKKKIKKKCF